MGEKKTDHFMLQVWESVFGCSYETDQCSHLFGSLRPDGWYEYTSSTGTYLFIIENKQSVKSEKGAIKQGLKYYQKLTGYKSGYNSGYKSDYKDLFLIIGLGKTKTTFEYKIYQIKDAELIKYDYSLEHIKEIMDYKTEFNESVIHEFNQYMWENGINLPKSQKTLFVAGILLALKIDPDFISNYKPDLSGFIIADKIIELINNHYTDPAFSSQFKFISKSLHNKHLFDLITKIKTAVSNYQIDVLNQFYSEFCKYDKNNDSQLGVVLTPHDIVSLMISELQIKENHSVLDFCTGTGSFLLESSKFTKNLIGCENNEERYALCKCNFILNGLDYSKLYFNSCFAQKFDKYDRSIINPPFSTNSSDVGLVDLNETHWKEFNKEQKFLLYQVQHLKIGGMGACIIPRSNFNNTMKKTIRFKSELLKHIVINKVINCNSKIFISVASVECAIIIYTRIKSQDLPQVSKNVTIIDYTNDGYQIKKKLRIRVSEPNIKEQVRDLDYTSDFNYQINLLEDYPDQDHIKILLIRHKINCQYYERMNILNNTNIDLTDYLSRLKQEIQEIQALNIVKYEYLKVGDYFKIINIKKKFKICSSDEGIYPLISSTSVNNGICKHINDYSYDGECITVARNGSVGVSFYHSCKIAITSDIIILQNIVPVNYHIWVSMLNYSLPPKYSYSNKLSAIKLLNEIIPIPIFKNTES